MQKQLIQGLLTIDRNSDTPVYLQISNAFIFGIRQGKLRKGLKLPGTRETADWLEVNRMTVVAAFDELEAQGWIERVQRKGSFVKTDLPVLAPRKIGEKTTIFNAPEEPLFSYSPRRVVPVRVPEFPEPGKLYINDGFPDVRLAPMEELARAMRSFSRLAANKRFLYYGGAQGVSRLREIIARLLNDTRGLPATAGNILLTRGAQMGIYLSASLVLKRGDEVVVGQPGYTAATNTFLQLGAKVNFVPVDEEGLNIDVLEKICARKKIRMVYVIPHHHNPTTVTLTPERRVRLLELAAKYRFALLEDDYDYDFHFLSKPLLPMASLDTKGSVIYIGTLTKTIAPAVRLGYICAPRKFIESATILRKYLDTQGDSLLEHAIAELYTDGTIARHIKKSVSVYRERRDYFCRLLKTELGDKVHFSIPDGGMAVWTRFLHADPTEVAARAYPKGLVMRDGKSYDSPKIKFNAVRMGFASLNEKEQEKAVAIIREIIQ